MVAYGAGSVVCSLYSGYIPAGSVGRSMVQEGAGGKTQVRRRCYRQNVMTMSNTMYKMELLHIFLKTKWTGEGAFFHPERQSWISQCIDTWYLFNNILGYAILLLLNSTLQLLIWYFQTSHEKLHTITPVFYMNHQWMIFISQVASLFGCLVVLVVIVAIGPLFYHLPKV